MVSTSEPGSVTTPVTTSIPSSPSNASRKSRNLDDLDAHEPIYTNRIGLRALWTDWFLEVRVFSGALGKAPSDEEMPWDSEPVGLGLTLSYELRPGGERPGPPELWAVFDSAVGRLGVAM